MSASAGGGRSVLAVCSFAALLLVVLAAYQIAEPKRRVEDATLRLQTAMVQKSSESEKSHILHELYSLKGRESLRSSIASLQARTELSHVENQNGIDKLQTAHTTELAGLSSSEMYNFVSRAKLLRATGSLFSEAPGLSCLSDLGLNASQLESYKNSTDCLSARIKASMGIGLAERMVKDFVEAPGIYGQLSECMKGWDAKTRSAVVACKSSVLLDSSVPMTRLLTAPARESTLTQGETLQELRQGRHSVRGDHSVLDTLEPKVQTFNDLRVMGIVRAEQLKQLTGLNGGGTVCLSEQGLNASQVQSYENATLCLGDRIKEGVGPFYTSEHVVQDFLEGSDNYESLYACLADVEESTRIALRACLRPMAEGGEPLPVVNFWEESLKALDAAGRTTLLASNIRVSPQTAMRSLEKSVRVSEWASKRNLKKA